MIYTIEKETEKKAKVCAVSTIFIYTGKMCLEIKSKAHEEIKFYIINFNLLIR